MANKKNLSGILALTLIFVTVLIGCDLFGGGDGGSSSGSKTDSALNGTWSNTVQQTEVTLGSGTFTWSSVSGGASTPMMRGSFTTSGNNQMTMTVTAIHGSFINMMSGGMIELGNQFYTKSQMESAIKAQLREMISAEEPDLSAAELTAAVNQAYARGSEEFDQAFETQTGTYSISGSGSGSTLTIIMDGEAEVFTKK